MRRVTTIAGMAECACMIRTFWFIALFVVKLAAVVPIIGAAVSYSAFVVHFAAMFSMRAAWPWAHTFLVAI